MIGTITADDALSAAGLIGAFIMLAGSVLAATGSTGYRVGFGLGMMLGAALCTFAVAIVRTWA